MAKSITQYDLLISCPSDVKEELNIINETISEFNRIYGIVNNMSIVAKHWYNDSYPGSGGHPQKLLNKQFVLDCDVAVAVFWTRFGTPTEEYGSGTEEEIEELIKSGKQVFLYFSDCQINPSIIDHDQYQKVLSFRNKYKDKGIYWTYSNLDDFKKSILNHISLYFVKLLTSGDALNNTNSSKLCIKGVYNGKISEQPTIFTTHYSNSEYIDSLRNSIVKMYEEIKSIHLPKKIEKNEEPTVRDIPSHQKELTSMLGKSIVSLQEQMKGISNIFPSSIVHIDDRIKSTIEKYGNENNIDFSQEEFFYVGQLTKQQQLVGGGPLGMNPSYQLVGSDDEKKKYKLIQDLAWKIDEFMQFMNFFSELDSKYCLELSLVNHGTHYDEDVDVKIYIESGILCTKEKLPFPGDDILEMANKVFNSIFQSSKSVTVDEYTDYFIIPSKPNIPLYGMNGLSYKDEIENNKAEYNNLLETIFCYDYFKEDGNDIACYNLKYIKQNTNVYFPSKLFFNAIPTKIIYEISSKHYPELIKGELNISFDNK